MRIIGPPTLDVTTLISRVSLEPNVHKRFVDEMLPALWAITLPYGLDPVGVIAQSFKETGGGNFQGKVRPGFFNTAGIKIRNLGAPGYPSGDEPFAHQQFANWYNGAEAHVQHLCAYAGVDVPQEDRVDPRFEIVCVKNYRCQSFEDLSGRWAVPGPTYGQEIVVIADRWRA